MHQTHSPSMDGSDTGYTIINPGHCARGVRLHVAPRDLVLLAHFVQAMLHPPNLRLVPAALLSGWPKGVYLRRLSG